MSLECRKSHGLGCSGLSVRIEPQQAHTLVNAGDGRDIYASALVGMRS